jgi:hypothetical protein
MMDPSSPWTLAFSTWMLSILMMMHHAYDDLMMVGPTYHVGHPFFDDELGSFDDEM